MIAEIRAVLIDYAKQRRTITYSELARQLQTCTVHPHSFIFAHLLRAACRQAVEAGEGFLCALVVRHQTGIPGAGYFRRDDLPPDLDTSALEALWRRELDQVFARWSPAQD
ncbi:MAG: hypothetical protein NZM00_09990 [Anaerolinea sp.]|nr:hypothetical protein [Anaerolinea sp.]